MPYKCEIRPLCSERYHLGEGPFWDQTNKLLYMVNIFKGEVICYDIPNNTRTTRTIKDGNVSFVIPFESDHSKLLVSKVTDDKSVICELNFETGDVKELALLDPNAKTRFNDGKCDSAGRLWTGTMGISDIPMVWPEDKGSVYKYDFHNLTKHDDGMTLSNGLGWSLDGQTMYFVDSAKHVVYGYDFEPIDGKISNRTVIFNYDTDLTDNQRVETGSCGEFPDGLTIDVNGNLWVACFNGGRILHIDPRSKSLIDYIQLPANYITSLCFGGDDMTTMYVTSAYLTMTDDQRSSQPEAGAVFEVKLSNPVRGVESVKFKDMKLL